MIRLFLIFVISYTFLQSETFEERQKTLQDIKNVIQYEESVARIYELYILNNLKLPTIAEINTDLDGNIKDFISIDNKDKVNLTTLTSGLPKISYALGDVLKADLSIKSLYDSNTYRKKTYVRGDAVYFILEDIFAKHLFDLIALNNNTNKEIKECGSTNSDTACIYNNHIYIEPTYSSGSISGYLMCYHIDKFKTGPIVISSVTSHEVFKSIAKGTLIYDITGVKYIKTTLGIEVLK
jgi:hypothetical protein